MEYAFTLSPLGGLDKYVHLTLYMDNPILQHQSDRKKANNHLCFKGTSQNTYGL